MTPQLLREGVATGASVTTTGGTTSYTLTTVPAEPEGTGVAYSVVASGPGATTSPSPATLVTIDRTAPVLVILSRGDDATDVALSVSPVLTLSEGVARGTAGAMSVRRRDTDALLTSIPFDSPNLVISGSAATFDLPADLPGSTSVYITVPGGLLTDVAGNAFAGISGTDSWSFDTPCAGTTTVMTFAGADQSVTVPVGCRAANVELWGAGGGAGAKDTVASAEAYGGGGAYATGRLTATPGETLTVIVGGGGSHWSSRTQPGTGFGGGGAANHGNEQSGGGGGGRSAIRRGSTELITAAGGGGGGGGGGSPKIHGGPGGDTTGGGAPLHTGPTLQCPAALNLGRPATPSAGGPAVSSTYNTTNYGSPLPLE